MRRHILEWPNHEACHLLPAEVRSIKRAERLKLSDLTILVGPNNEGKSNILRGLVVGMRILSLAERIGLVRGRYRVASRAFRSEESQDYEWDRDFPLDLQDASPEGKTIFDFEFELSSMSDAIDGGVLAVDLLGGSGNLSHKLSQLAQALCSYHAFLDHDPSGRATSNRAELEGLLDASKRTYAICPGKADSEMEDLYDRALYADMIRNKYTVDITGSVFGNSKARWSMRMKKAFQSAGQPWDENIAKQVKLQVADLVADSPASALLPGLRSPFDAVVTALESRISGS
ncbi:MAG TPA: hypothetical protein VFM81_04125 [Actinomycetota bacterium]|nr:hypothetical protein [Actinomycetota bacterium]